MRTSDTSAEATIRIAGTEGPVLRPASVSELGAILREATPGSNFIPVGGATALSVGNAPAAPWSAILLRGLPDDGFQHDRDDLVVTCAAWMPLGELNGRLQDRGQWVPVDPPGGDGATVGGALALGLGGPLSTGYGQPRDLALGAAVMRSDGVIARAGGRVVKNVTGYDMVRLWAGSLGTLGILTEVTLRTYPLPRLVTVASPIAGLAEAMALAEQLYRSGTNPRVLEVVSAGPGYRVVAQFEPTVAREVMVARTPVEEASPAMVEALRDLEVAPLAVRVSAQPGQCGGLVDTVRRLRPSIIALRPVRGIVRAAWNSEDLPDIGPFAAWVAETRVLLARVGGRCLVTSMPDTWRTMIDAWGPTPSAFALMRATKAAYDPEGKLNRGRYVGGI